MHLSNLGRDSERIERRLLLLAFTFVLLDALALSLAPAVRSRTWDAPLRLDHWVGVGLWLLSFAILHLQASRRLPGRDPFLLPAAALLSGWGMLTIWRLLPAFGLRQSIWLLISALVLALVMLLPAGPALLRRYKYVWLTGVLLITAATLVFGVNPLGYGPRMWLTLAGLYFQPSELLKVLLVVYLAAYVADRQPYLVLASAPHTSLPRWVAQVIPLLAPTILMTGMALAVLGLQRDLGTAFIYLMLYGAVVFVAVGRRRILVVAGLGLAAAGVIGYLLYDVVRVRVDAWINPWLDPAGRSYQIVQSLIAIANGGTAGRGLGLGSPGLAPLAHSDMIFSAIAEEFGMAGVVVLLGVFGLLAARGMAIALYAPDHYQRYLAAGLTVLLVGQGLLIMGGNLRLLPLTGVTLPFVSYGGSSLLISFLALLLLMMISSRSGRLPARLYQPRSYMILGGGMLFGLALAGLATGWWVVVRGPALLGRTDNQRRAIDDRFVLRGALLDRNDRPVSQSGGEPGEYTRIIEYPDLSVVAGYNDPTYGQAGLEEALDDRLRGLHGYPWQRVLIDRLLYGQPPPGLDVRLTLDLDLQQRADELLGSHTGALVLLDARTGEVLAMASHPTFDASRLVEEWDGLVDDPSAPLLNRAVLGRYPTGGLETRLFPGGIDRLDLATASARYPGLLAPSGRAPLPGEEQPEGFSPLQMALAAASISSGGARPLPQIVQAVRTPEGNWESPPALGEPLPVFEAGQAADIAGSLALGDRLWSITAPLVSNTGEGMVWFVGGTRPESSGRPLALALLLEQDNPSLAEAIGREMLSLLIGQ